MKTLDKVKVAFDRFDEKGPLPNLNDSIVFDNFYRNTEFSQSLPKLIIFYVL